MRHASAAAVTLSLAAFVFFASLHAQQQRGGSGTIHHKSDIPGSGREAVASVHQWEPHTATAWHTHPGEMVGFVTEGSVVVEQRGASALTVRTGESFIIPAGVPHTSINTGDTNARMFVTYIVAKDQSLSSPASR